MRQTERYYRIDQLIRARGVIDFKSLQQALEVSRATLVRDLAALRDRFNAPIVYDRERGEALPDGSYELRLPFSASAELEMDVLRHAETVEVLAPPALRERIAAGRRRRGPGRPRELRYDRTPWPFAPPSTSSSCRSPTSIAGAMPIIR